ncbi:putative zinc-binding oxidoreductase [Aspergillus karnatakaensis]|uniref:NADP-dependent oxidoreductase n=1 Tax=Aspergillus karnatakaensis TaxID=1810916 RepID=UPI003CCDDB75
MSTQPLPTSIRALLQADPNSHKITLVQREVPTPDASKNEHLIRVHAASPCAGELNWAKFVNIPGKEIITCDDVAGVVVSAPSDSPFQPGSEVYARTNYWRPGCARDYTIATTDELALRAKNLSWAESAATPLSAETAWQAFFTHAEIGEFGSSAWKGKRILVTAAAGGAGVWLVQIGKLLGAEVIGTAGPKNTEYLKGLGAAEVLDYHTVDFKAWGSEEKNKVDLVIDCIGGKSLEDAWWTLKDNGTIIGIVQPPIQRKPEGLELPNVTDKYFIMTPNGTDLEEVTKLIEAGKVWPVVDSIWSLEQFEHGYARLESGHARGKVIFDLTLNVPK